jgi:hypothetical protein
LDDGTLTPTLKLRRRAIDERYRELIDSAQPVPPFNPADISATREYSQVDLTGFHRGGHHVEPTTGG